MVQTEHIFLKEILIRNFLSYGPQTAKFQLDQLNVLIGSNMSGKSNFIETLTVLREAARDLSNVFEDGVTEWLWKGPKTPPEARIEVCVRNEKGHWISNDNTRMPLHYVLAFTVSNVQGSQQLRVVDEVIENAYPWPDHDTPFYFYRYNNGRPRIRVVTDWRNKDLAGVNENRDERPLNVDPHRSVLNQLRDPETYPELTYLATQFQRIRIYSDWPLGRNSAPRLPQPADRPNDFLLEDASNLGLVINYLEHQHPREWAQIGDFLHQFYGSIKDVSTSVKSNQIQLYISERGLGGPKIPATRISDGMMRFLCLLTILCHPEPPPLICIEEPEIGLHPDAIGIVAKLLKEASTRTQIIVTTHSESLISALSDVPEAIVICEKNEGQTSLRRLSRERLQEWLEDYSLGELWAKGEIGGTSNS